MVLEELDEGYLTTVRSYLKDLRFDGGVMVSATLGPGNEIGNHMLRKPNARIAHRLRSVLGPKAPSYSFTLDPRDESGTRALAELRDRGSNFAADALARSAEHVEHFFRVLKQELAFYLGCLNLHHSLESWANLYVFRYRKRLGHLCSTAER